MKNIAVIGGGVMASYFALACSKLGYKCHYFSLADGKIDNDSAVFHEINIFDKDKIVSICEEINVQGVVATTELSVPIAAYVAEKLHLPGIPVSVAENITNKLRNRECIENLQTLKSPRFIKASCQNDIKKAEFSYPIILKPLNLGGKRGISVIKNEEELGSAISYLKTYIKSEKDLSFIVEEFLEGGAEYSVESISIKGKHYIIQVTQKDSSGAPHCVELGHHQPAELSDEMYNRVVEAISDGLSAIGIEYGPCHTEIKIIDNNIYLIEFNARPGGDHIWYPLIELSTGFDVMSAVIKVSTGELGNIDKSEFKKRYSGLYYVVKQTDYLKPIFENCEKMPWCKEKHFVSNNLIEMKQNDMEHINYFIYASDSGNPIISLLDTIY